MKFAIYLSLGANIILLFAKLGIYIVTLSNSIAASLADSVSIRKGVFVSVCVLCVCVFSQCKEWNPWSLTLFIEWNGTVLLASSSPLGC